MHSESRERSKSVLYLFSNFSSVPDANIWNDTHTFKVGLISSLNLVQKVNNINAQICVIYVISDFVRSAIDMNHYKFHGDSRTERSTMYLSAKEHCRFLQTSQTRGMY